MFFLSIPMLKNRCEYGSIYTNSTLLVEATYTMGVEFRYLKGLWTDKRFLQCN